MVNKKTRITNRSKSNKKNSLSKKLRNFKFQLNRKSLIIVGLFFGLIGAITLSFSLAATILATLEAESMSLPGYTYVYNDDSASQKKAIIMSGNGTATTPLTINNVGSGITVKAKGGQCNGAPKMIVSIDGKQVLSADVSATEWTSYNAAVNITSGTHTVAINFSNDYYSAWVCDRNLYIDNIRVTSEDVASPTPVACSVLKSTLLSVEGGNQDWSHALDLIAYDKPDANGNSQLRIMRPDGSGDKDISTYATAPGLLANRHKTVPIWEPSGRWIVMQVESSDWYPGVDYRDAWLRERAINGVSSSLWAASPDGSRWVRLTNEAWPSSYGVMAAHFSKDGKKILFSRLVEPASSTYPWGKYRLIIADFNIDAQNNPSITNQRDITPAGHNFAESHGFSPDGRTALFASYFGKTDHNDIDIWKLDLATSVSTKLTTSTVWDEHANYSPLGRKIVYMAGELGTGPLTGELMLMNPDGSNKQRLTAFNQAGKPGYSGETTMVMRPTYNAAGTRMVVTEMLTRDFPAHRRMSVMDLSGDCN